MGCNNSKAGKIGVLEVSPANNGKTPPSSARKESLKSRRLLKRAQLGEDRFKKRASVDSLDSQKSLKSESDRGFSATSKSSKHSQDSGLGDGDDLNMITEDSDPNKVKEIEQNFREPNLEFGIVGVKCGSANDQDRLDEQRIIAALRQEGLISKTTSKAHGGVAFEVFEESSTTLGRLPPIRPPPRLEKLEKIRKKQKKPLTEDEIKAKLERAERRRKERVAARAKRNQQDQKEQQVRETADNVLHERQTQIQVTTNTDMDTKERKRELKMLERQRKLQAKAEHAERVRQRKMAALQAGAPRQEEGDVATELPNRG